MDHDRHQDHFNKASPEVRERLLAIQREVEARLPEAERCVGYGMPAFRKDRIFFYFAAFKQHIGVFPPIKGVPELLARLAPHRGPKGNLKFRHSDPLPLTLIGDVAEALAQQYERGDGA